MSTWDIVATFDQSYGPKMAGRAPTFRAVVREALILGVKNIVETGSIRKENNWDGDGQSTIIWTAFAKYQNGHFTSIDISKDAMALVTKLCPTATTICMDSVKALEERTFSIDLLYLDSYDLDASTPHDAALHCLLEFCAAKRNLHKGSIVFVDDSPMGHDWKVGGKGMYIGKYFEHLGVKPFAFGYQCAWLMP